MSKSKLFKNAPSGGAKKKVDEPTKREIDASAEPGTLNRPDPVPEAAAPGLSENGPVIYFSKRLSYKIGRIPTTVSYELRGQAKHKVVHKGEKICFTGGRYVCRDEEEKIFLDQFIIDYPNRIFKFDPIQKKLEMELAAVIAKHKAALGSTTKGKQGASGGK